MNMAVAMVTYGDHMLGIYKLKRQHKIAKHGECSMHLVRFTHMSLSQYRSGSRVHCAPSQKHFPINKLYQHKSFLISGFFHFRYPSIFWSTFFYQTSNEVDVNVQTNQPTRSELTTRKS